MPTHYNQGGPPPEAMLGGMGAMLGGAPEQGPEAPIGPGGPLPATDVPSNEGGDAQVIAQLAFENVQMRELLGLGPDDPIPVPEGAGPPPGAPVPGPAPAGPVGPAPGGQAAPF